MYEISTKELLKALSLLKGAKKDTRVDILYVLGKEELNTKNFTVYVHLGTLKKLIQTFPKDGCVYLEYTDEIKHCRTGETITTLYIKCGNFCGYLKDHLNG